MSGSQFSLSHWSSSSRISASLLSAVRGAVSVMSSPGRRVDGQRGWSVLSDRTHSHLNLTDGSSSGPLPMRHDVPVTMPDPDLEPAGPGTARSRRGRARSSREASRRRRAAGDPAVARRAGLADALGWHVEWRFKHWPVVYPAEGLAVLTPHRRCARSARCALAGVVCGSGRGGGASPSSSPSTAPATPSPSSTPTSAPASATPSGTRQATADHGRCRHRRSAIDHRRPQRPPGVGGAGA